MNYLWAMMLSLFPQRYRLRSSLEGTRTLWRAAVLCGMFQAGLFLFASISLFITRAPNYWDQASGVVLNNEKGPQMDPVGVRLATGTLGLAGYLLNPLPLLLAYLTVEGGIRAVSPVVFGHILPTLSLGVIAAFHNLADLTRYQKPARELMKDEILPPQDETYDLHIRSATPKRDWSPYIGIHFRGELYILAGEQTEAGPRPFGYRLRKNPEGSLVVVTCNYDPEDKIVPFGSM